MKNIFKFQTELSLSFIFLLLTLSLNITGIVVSGLYLSKYNLYSFEILNMKQFATGLLTLLSFLLIIYISWLLYKKNNILEFVSKRDSPDPFLDLFNIYLFLFAFGSILVRLISPIVGGGNAADIST